MGFFREDRFGGFSGLSYLSNLEKLHTVFMDVETEGRARGYELAAEKYKEAFSRIQKEDNELKKNIDEQIQNTDIAAQTLILKLKDLEDKKASLEHQRDDKLKRVSDKCGIPYSEITESLEKEMFVGPGMNWNVLDMAYEYKKVAC